MEDSLAISILFESGAIGSILGSDATPGPWSYEAAVHENPMYFPTDEIATFFSARSDRWRSRAWRFGATRIYKDLGGSIRWNSRAPRWNGLTR